MGAWALRHMGVCACHTASRFLLTHNAGLSDIADTELLISLYTSLFDGQTSGFGADLQNDALCRFAPADLTAAVSTSPSDFLVGSGGDCPAYSEPHVVRYLCMPCLCMVHGAPLRMF